jgi:hypothetical protein
LVIDAAPFATSTSASSSELDGTAAAPVRLFSVAPTVAVPATTETAPARPTTTRSIRGLPDAFAPITTFVTDPVGVT